MAPIRISDVWHPNRRIGRYGQKYLHDNTFSGLLTLLTLDKSGTHKGTVRGVGSELVLDPETIFRYQTGISKAPSVVIEDMLRLLAGRLPDPTFWDEVAELTIRPKIRKMEDSGKREDVFEITFNTVSFFTRRFSVFVNRKFRQVLFEQANLYTPPIEKITWVRIAERALEDGHYGINASGVECDADEFVRYCTVNPDQE